MVPDGERRRYLQWLGAGAGAALAGCNGLSLPGGDRGRKVDDWQYSPSDLQDDGFLGGIANVLGSSGGMGRQSAASSSADLGFAAGGAKDVATFRRNVDEGNLPLPESMATEGLYYDYYFDTGESAACESLFCPTYSPAVTADPLSGDPERYLGVGLDSNLSTDEFERKALNLVVTLDVSGSMDSPFSEYYYDRTGARRTPEGDTDASKIEVARDALVALTEQLRPEDRLGVVLYNDDSAVAKPVRAVEETDMDAIRGHVRDDVRAGGGTNMEAGMRDAMDLLSAYDDADPATRENRVIFLTDAMPNLGETSDEGLRSILESNAAEGRHATVVGVGLDFNPALVDELTAIRGANYYGVNSAEEFERRLGEEFAYMVTPLVFDLDVELDAEGYEIDRVYGSTAADEATGELMRVNTLFPSPTEDGRTRGGIVLVKLRRTGDAGEVTLSASWETRTGETDATERTLTLPDAEPDHFDSSGVRKAVLLARYADLVRNWTVHERDADAVPVGADEEATPDGSGEHGTATPMEEGIVAPPEDLGEWERQSEPLTVSAPYDERIATFRDHFASEADALGDEDLERELETMDAILDQG